MTQILAETSYALLSVILLLLLLGFVIIILEIISMLQFDS